ncbi:MAG: hypothetical protein BWY57_01624 [Betaproteobacteria bacterium ADurb.Bin341]|nr:MAG: hypothetical protein BWY57_01624 [Betaproteobacteria bacterium ADurb.Bin341]
MLIDDTPMNALFALEDKQKIENVGINVKGIIGLSIRAYARHRGVSHVAVKKAIDAGRITPEADGASAVRRWYRGG